MKGQIRRAAPKGLLAVIVAGAFGVATPALAGAARRHVAAPVAIGALKVVSVSTPTLNQDETTVVRVKGTGFQAGATASFGNGITAVTQSVTSTQIALKVVVARAASYGFRTLTVTNPDKSKSTLRHAVHVDYVAVLARWAVGDGAVDWTTTLARPLFLALPSISFTGTGVTIAHETVDSSHHLSLGFTISPSAQATWRDMTIRLGSTTWFVPKGLRVRPAPVVTSMSPVAQGAASQSVQVVGTNFEVCAKKKATFTFSGTGVSVDAVGVAFKSQIFVQLTVSAAAATGPRDVTIVNCDSGGRSTSKGKLTVVHSGPTIQLDTPVVTSVAPSTTSGAAIEVAYTGSANAPAGQHYTAHACTDAAMTKSCVLQSNYASGSNLGRLKPGTTYYVTVVALGSPGYLGATSGVSGPAAATIQLNAPAVTAVSSSTTTVGQISVSFTASSNAPGGQAYTATACTNASMTVACVAQGSFASGTALTGLAAGSSYYLRVTAQASTGYLAGASPAEGPVLATVQLATPSSPALSFGTVAGSIRIVSASSNAAAGQTYTAKACTNSAMTTGCVTDTKLTPGANMTGLAYAKGVPGSSYFVVVTANASAGHLRSAASTQASHAAMSQLNVPVILSTSSTVKGTIRFSFRAGTGASASSFVARACTNVAMTAGCVTVAGFKSGGAIGGLVPGKGYYLEVIAMPPVGYLGAVSGVRGPVTAFN